MPSTSQPPAGATILEPSRDSAWQPTHLPPAFSGPANRSASVCAVLPKSNRMMADPPEPPAAFQ